MYDELNGLADSAQAGDDDSASKRLAPDGIVKLMWQCQRDKRSADSVYATFKKEKLAESSDVGLHLVLDTPTTASSRLSTRSYTSQATGTSRTELEVKKINSQLQEQEARMEANLAIVKAEALAECRAKDNAS